MKAQSCDSSPRGDRADRRRDRTGNGRVLVVDDSAMFRVIVSRMLEREGYLVRCAEDGVAALALVPAERFDVVVSDLAMPGFDGFELLRALRASAEPPEVVFLSGARADDFEAAVRALRLGAHDFLTKPPREEELLHAVGRALETRRLKDENRRLLRELERETRTDPLTQAGNRRAFSEALRQEMSRTRRYGSPLGVAVVDLDHFKRTNDTWGHAAGDEVLRVFADRVRRILRDGDALFRLGGEEFVVLLPCTDLDGAAAAAERLLEALRESPVRHGESLVPVTASVGVTCLAPGDHGAEDLLARADAALYIAKRSGRDRVVASPDPGLPKLAPPPSHHAMARPEIRPS